MIGDSTLEQQEAALPVVLMDDGADFYYAAGHVDPAMFALAVVVDVAAAVGAAEAVDVLCGGRRRTPEAVGRFLADVRHSWWRHLDGDDPEQMVRCEATDDGAQAFTEVAL